MKVVFDTNVYVSDALFDALAEALVEAARDGKFLLYVSDFILQELRQVLIEKFKVSRRFASLTVKRVQRIARLTQTGKRRFPGLGDPKDHPVLETAVNAGADFLVTGDKVLLAFSPYNGIEIIPLGQFKVRIESLGPF